MNARTQQILESVDNLLKVHDEWEADETAPVQPTAAFEDAIKLAIETCDNGDIPAQCRDLCFAMNRLDLEWEYYETGVRRTPDHRPVSSFWGAFRNLVTCREHARPMEIKQPEPVFLLLEQKVPTRQIAFNIWGHLDKSTGRYVGPFVTSANQVDEVKIREESKEPGKHTAGWVHPEQLERQRERQRELSHRLGAVTRREKTDSRTVEKASVLEMLKEGQYPDVIARVKGVPIDDVLAEAQRNSIVPTVRPNLAAERAPQEPGIFGAGDDSTEFDSARDGEWIPVGDTADDGDVDAVEEVLDQEPTEPAMSDDELIRSLADGHRGTPEIVAACREQGRTVTYQQVKAVLKPVKK
jgi:hypothetical protein